MLVFISDLHFIDGTAGNHNVPIDAFKIFFENITGMSERLKREGKEIKEIQIVFLGDLFDLLRTERWLDYPEEERSWGTNETKIEQHANAVFDGIIDQNEETFNLLKGNLKEEFGLPFEPKRVYVPGNHDRLCSKAPPLTKGIFNPFGNPVQGDCIPLNPARHSSPPQVAGYSGGFS